MASSDDHEIELIRKGAALKTKRTSYLLFLLLSVFLTCLLIFKNFIFGERLVLFRDIGSDTFYSYYRFYYFLTDQIHNWDFSFWSFKMGIGTSVLTLYAFLYDPFSLIYYIIGADNISTAIVYVFILKIVLAAFFSYLFFNYIKVGIIPTIICSFLFAFNGYLMLWGQHYYFASVVIFLPLLLYALERFMQEDKWLLLLVVIAMTSLNIYIFYQMFIFVIIYYVFRFYSNYSFDLRLFIKMTGKFMAVFFLAIGTVSALILPEYYLLQSNPRTSSQSVVNIFNMDFHFNSIEYYFSILCRFFSNNLQGIGSSYKGFLNYYESLQLYCGLLFLVLSTQALCLFNRKQKVLVLAGILVSALFIIFPLFAQIMNGFQYPSYRWGYDIIFAELLLLSYILKAIIDKREVNFGAFFITAVFLIGCLLIINSQYDNEIEIHKNNTNIIWQSFAFILIYGISIFFLTKKGFKRKLSFVFILVFLSVEMLEEHKDTFEKRSTLTKGIEAEIKADNYDYGIDLFGYTNDVVSYLESIDSSIFRLEKNRWISSMNDSVVQGYNGLDTYNSLNTPSYLEFIRDLNIPPVPHAPAMTVQGWSSLQRPYLADMLSVKYYLTKDKKVVPASTRFIKTIGDIHVFEREEALPFGFVYDKYIDRGRFFSIKNETNRNHMLLRGFLPPEDLHTKYMIDGFSEISYKDPENDIFVSKISNTLIIESFAEDNISGNITLPGTRMLFLSIPYDPGWHATVNHERVDIQKINAGFSGLLLNKGTHQIELKYVPPYLKEGLIISFISVIIIMGLLFREKKVVRNSLRIS